MCRVSDFEDSQTSRSQNKTSMDSSTTQVSPPLIYITSCLPPPRYTVPTDDQTFFPSVSSVAVQFPAIGENDALVVVTDEPRKAGVLLEKFKEVGQCVVELDRRRGQHVRLSCAVPQDVDSKVLWHRDGLDDPERHVLAHLAVLVEMRLQWAIIVAHGELVALQTEVLEVGLEILGEGELFGDGWKGLARITT